MADFDQRMRDLELADLARRASNADELIALAESYYAAPDTYFASRGLTMEPSEANRVHRGHDTAAMRKRNSRTFGVAAAITSDGTLDTRAAANTVRVIAADGTVSTRDASSFRAPSVHKKQRDWRTALNGTESRVARDHALAERIGSIHPTE